MNNIANQVHLFTSTLNSEQSECLLLQEVKCVDKSWATAFNHSWSLEVEEADTIFPLFLPSHKMQLHNTNNFIVKTWLVISPLNCTILLHPSPCHAALAMKVFSRVESVWRDDGKQETLNSSNYTELKWLSKRTCCAQKSCIMH